MWSNSLVLFIININIHRACSPFLVWTVYIILDLWMRLCASACEKWVEMTWDLMWKVSLHQCRCSDIFHLGITCKVFLSILLFRLDSVWRAVCVLRAVAIEHGKGWSLLALSSLLLYLCMYDFVSCRQLYRHVHYNWHILKPVVFKCSSWECREENYIFCLCEREFASPSINYQLCRSQGISHASISS